VHTTRENNEIIVSASESEEKRTQSKG